jgi:hypothetical protein
LLARDTKSLRSARRHARDAEARGRGHPVRRGGAGDQDGDDAPRPDMILVALKVRLRSA